MLRAILPEGKYAGFGGEGKRLSPGRASGPFAQKSQRSSYGEGQKTGIRMKKAAR